MNRKELLHVSHKTNVETEGLRKHQNTNNYKKLEKIPFKHSVYM